MTQRLVCKDATGKQIAMGFDEKESVIELPKPDALSTKPNQEPIGTIVCKCFKDHGWHKGQVIHCNPHSQLHSIAHTNGDTQQLDAAELKQHWKKTKFQQQNMRCRQKHLG